MDKTLEIILAFVLIGSTLAFGGVQPLTYSISEVVIFLCVLLLLLKQTREGSVRLPLPLWPVVFALWVLLQVIPLPSRFIEGISPARFSELKLGSLLSSQRALDTLSIYPHDTAIGLIKFLAYLSAFVLAAYLFDTGKRKSTLIRGLMFIGCFEATYGIVQYLTGWQKIFTYTKEYDLSEATGTYINRNHFAGLLELTSPFIAAFALYEFQRWSEGRRRKRQPSGNPDGSAARIMFYLFWFALTSLAIIFSRSRAGILAAVFSFLLMALLTLPKVQRQGWMVGVFLFLVSAVGLGLWIGLGPVLARFEQMGDPNYLRIEPRFTFWRDSLPFVRDYFLTGSGLGTFGLGFRHYQTTWVEKLVDHAHNDYLEIAAETGPAGAALVFFPIFWLIGKMVVSFLRQVGRYRSAVTLGCIGSTVGLLLHSFIDFNLQIPANALVFAVVLGIAYKIVCVERREDISTPRPEKPRKEVPSEGAVWSESRVRLDARRRFVTPSSS